MAFPSGDPGRGRSQPTQGLEISLPRDICGFSAFFSSQLDSTSVRHTALSLVSVILKRVLKTIDHCLNKELWQESGVYTAVMMEEFVLLFRDALSKVGTGPGLAFPYRPCHRAGQGDGPWWKCREREPSDVCGTGAED